MSRKEDGNGRSRRILRNVERIEKEMEFIVGNIAL
jgi:hypothetical protein